MLGTRSAPEPHPIPAFCFKALSPHNRGRGCTRGLKGWIQGPLQWECVRRADNREECQALVLCLCVPRLLPDTTSLLNREGGDGDQRRQERGVPRAHTHEGCIPAATLWGGGALQPHFTGVREGNGPIQSGPPGPAGT